jgi:hypothetical protein
MRCDTCAVLERRERVLTGIGAAGLGPPFQWYGDP